MANGSGTGLGPVIAAKIICCGGLVLAATGVLSGLRAWVTGGGHLWVAGAAAVLVVGALLYRYVGRAEIRGGAESAPQPPAWLVFKSHDHARADSD